VTVEANRKLKGLAKRSADCKEGMIIVESGNHDVQCSSQDCQILESRIKVQFLDCPGQPIESAIFRETVGSCELSISVVPASSQISTKSSTPVSATLMLGCAALDGKTVTFSVTGPATINTSSAITSANGIISTTLTAGNQEGTATVKAEATVKYPVREILINGSVEEAFYRTETASGQTDVTIKRMPQSWHIALDVQLDNAPSNIGMGNGHDHVTYSAHVETDISFDTSVSTYCFKNTNGNQTLGDILVESPSPAISLTVENKNAPSSFPCRVVAFFDSSQVYFFITRSMIDMSSEDVAFATWDIRCIYPWQDTVVTDRFIHRFYRCGPAGTGTNFKFPANQNTYTTSGCFTTATYGYEGTYTLTATKITP
jgi:hypothetical protein